MLGTTQKLVLAFVTLLLGVVLIGSVATNTNAVTSTTQVRAIDYGLTSCFEAMQISASAGGYEIDETNAACNITVANAPSGWVKTENYDIENVAVRNGTGTTWTVNTDYKVFANDGIIMLLNTTSTRSSNESTANKTTYDYDYYPTTYMAQSWSRSMLNLIAGFFALALMGVAVGLFYSVAKDAKII